MSHGRQLRLFLVDGTPNGLITAEILNWTGHVLTGPRSKLTELVQRPECGRTGVYFLVGPAPDNSLRPQVYIGESDDVAKRLKQHNRPESVDSAGGGRDFWEKVCLVTSKDQNLTKSHVKYLEALLIGIANNAGRCELVNGTAHDYGNLPEADRSDMAFFIEQIRTVLPVLGFEFLRESAKPSSIATPETAAVIVSVSPRFVLEVPKHKLRASAQEINGEFVVLKGSLARKEWIGVAGGYESLFNQLRSDILKPDANELCVFTDDYTFSSPSAAAAVISGRSANGRTMWSVEGTGQTYGAWQDQQVNSVTTPESKDA